MPSRGQKSADSHLPNYLLQRFQLSGPLVMFTAPTVVKTGLFADPLIYYYLSSAAHSSQTYRHTVSLMMGRKVVMVGPFKPTHEQKTDCPFIDLQLQALCETTAAPDHLTTESHFLTEQQGKKINNKGLR